MSKKSNKEPAKIKYKTVNSPNSINLYILQGAPASLTMGMREQPGL